MLNFKEGQTYICTKANERWLTEGKEYKVGLSSLNKTFILDDDGDRWTSNELSVYDSIFKLKEETQLSDLIENQPHYKNQGIEPIDLMRNNFSKEEFAGFLQGNVLKYMLRYKDKNGIEDLKKAKTYLTWLIEEKTNA